MKKPTAIKIRGLMKCFIGLFLCFISIKLSAQDISGLYSGTLINDSLKMVQNYELALSEYKGKITGYSYITFVSNDTFYYGIKRIKATRKNGELVVEDVAMLANNYPKRPDKGVHVINRIPLPPGQDTILNMNGRWETTGTKKFYSISGALNLRKDNDSTHSPLVAHLKELKVINYQDEKKEIKDIANTEIKQKPREVKAEPKETASIQNKPKAAATPSEPVENETIRTDIIAKRNPPKSSTAENKPKEIVSQKESIAASVTAETKPQENIAQENKQKQPIVSDPARNPIGTASKPAQNKPPISQSAVTETKPKTIIVAEQQKPIVTAVKTEKSNPKEIAPKEIKTPVVIANTQPKKSEPAIVKNSNAEEVKPIVISAQETAKTITDFSPIVKRATNTIQTVNVTADSLILTFYDNGVVDGDSISVYLNDQNIISKVKLTEAAVKKTIYTTSGNVDEMRLTLVAENLGSLPPNTGLLIIQDGSQRYQIRFSADMETNASVIIKKKK